MLRGPSITVFVELVFGVKYIGRYNLCVHHFFKAAVRSFSSLSPSLFEICNCSYSHIYQLYVGCASARHSADKPNDLRRTCGCQSVWILAFAITDSTFWKYDQHKYFHWKMSSEQVTSTFGLIN